MAQELVFTTLDVFSDHEFGGNPLAVYPHAEGLSTQLMQQIAREMNYSETTFVLPPKDPLNTAEVRIFTPVAELPFAGHPNVGTAWALAQRPDWVPGRTLDGHMTFEQRAGLVDVELQYAPAGALAACWITAPQPYGMLHTVPKEALADCLSIAADCFCGDGAVASVGIPFAFAEVVDRQALARCKPNLAGFEHADATYGYPDEGFSLMVYHRAAAGVVHGRMFGPLIGITEDPATGSAAAALAAMLAGTDSTEFVLHQGDDMGRPSVLHLRVQQGEGLNPKVQVGGSCQPMINGILQLDR